MKNRALSANQGGKRYDVKVLIDWFNENFDTSFKVSKNRALFAEHFFLNHSFLYIPKLKFPPNRQTFIIHCISQYKTCTVNFHFRTGEKALSPISLAI